MLPPLPPPPVLCVSSITPCILIGLGPWADCPVIVILVAFSVNAAPAISVRFPAFPEFAVERVTFDVIEPPETRSMPPGAVMGPVDEILIVLLAEAAD